MTGTNKNKENPQVRELQPLATKVALSEYRKNYGKNLFGNTYHVQAGTPGSLDDCHNRFLDNSSRTAADLEERLQNDLEICLLQLDEQVKKIDDKKRGEAFRRIEKTEQN